MFELWIASEGDGAKARTA